MPTQDTISTETTSKNNTDLRMWCAIGGAVAAAISWFCYTNGSSESGSWAAVLAGSAWFVAAKIQTKWSSKSRA